MNTMRCPKCGRELFNLIDDSDFVYHFWCPECLIDINIEENCPQPLEDFEDWDYNEDEGFDPYMGEWTGDC